MATFTNGEVFESQAVNHTPTGSFGQRIFIERWQDRYKASLPKIGDRWPADTYHSPPFTEGLWCHEIIPSPYGESGTPDTANNVASLVRLEYNYQSTPPLTTEANGWLITTQSVVASAEIGRGRSFTENPANKIEGGVPRQVPMLEVVIRGLEYLGTPARPSTTRLAEATEAAQGRLGRVCTEIYQPAGGFDPVPGQILFESEDTGDAFMRRIVLPAHGDQVAWYREFSRRFLVKRIIFDRGGAILGVAGHNQEWDAAAQIWDTVQPALYTSVQFAGPTPVFPF